MKTNDKVKLTLEEDRIIITKSKNTKISLEERFKNYHGENLVKDFEWDEQRGKKIWQINIFLNKEILYF